MIKDAGAGQGLARGLVGTQEGQGRGWAWVRGMVGARGELRAAKGQSWGRLLYLMVRV